jgi:hypothetical protein
VEPHPQHFQSGGGWIAWVAGFFLLAVMVALAIPLLLGSSRTSVERSASTSLKTLATAEADFRANDHVCDFWTADVKGLYTMTAAAERRARGGSLDPAIKLIELEVAAADADETFFPAAGENMPLAAFAVPAPREGYWYAALTLDLSVSGTLESTYRHGNSPGARGIPLRLSELAEG